MTLQKRIMKKQIFFSILMAVVACLSSSAQDAYTDTIYRKFDLDEVVVTGTRTPKFLKDTPIQTRVINAKEIARLDATNVQDLLQQELPGVEFTYAMNQQTHLNFSGFGGQGVLFLVDGERLAGETMDDVDFTRLSMDNVERIEIVKGAASALYGSNATGGVINIITKKSQKPVILNVNARYAKHNEQRYGGTFGLNGKHWNNMFTVNFNRMDNYDVHSASNPVTRIISTVYGDKTINFKDQLVWSPNKNFHLSGRAGYFFRETVRSADQPERYRDFSGGLGMQWNISEHDDFQASYAFDQYENRTINASPSSTFATTAMCKTLYDCSTTTGSIGEMCSPSVPTLCTTISTTLTWRTKRVTKTLGTCLDNTTGVFPTNGRLWEPCVMTISQMARSRTLRQNSMSATNLSTISQFVLDMVWDSEHQL